jgi:3-hydroxybutyryl-CoA dehydratase
MKLVSDHLVERSFAELHPGLEIEEEIRWNVAQLEAFRLLSGDDAPIHYDTEFALTLGLPQPILYGLLTVLPFSRILGCRLPGVFSIIQSLRLDFVQPIYPDETLRYRVVITQLSPATRSVALNLTIERSDGSVVLRGKAQCGLLR